jgi:hypothetical protein
VPHHGHGGRLLDDLIALHRQLDLSQAKTRQM